MLDLLGGHVLGVPIDLPRAGQRKVLRLAAHELGQAEVGDLDPALLVHEHVLGLDVAVDHALVVGVLQGVADLRHDGQGLFGVSLPASRSCRRFSAIDELHEEVIQHPALTPGPSPGGRGEVGIALTPGPSPETGEGRAV